LPVIYLRACNRYQAVNVRSLVKDLHFIRGIVRYGYRVARFGFDVTESYTAVAIGYLNA
jgi:hypothetical protein